MSVWLLCGEQALGGQSRKQEDQLGGYRSRSGKSIEDCKIWFGLGYVI